MKERMFNRRFAYTAVLALTLTSLAGCGETREDFSQRAPQPETAKPSQAAPNRNAESKSKEKERDTSQASPMLKPEQGRENSSEPSSQEMVSPFNGLWEIDRIFINNNPANLNMILGGQNTRVFLYIKNNQSLVFSKPHDPARFSTDFGKITRTDNSLEMQIANSPFLPQKFTYAFEENDSKFTLGPAKNDLGMEVSITLHRLLFQEQEDVLNNHPLRESIDQN